MFSTSSLLKLYQERCRREEVRVCRERKRKRRNVAGTEYADIIKNFVRFKFVMNIALFTCSVIVNL